MTIRWAAAASSCTSGPFRPARSIATYCADEARNAGIWAVGIAATGNEIGLTAAALAALPDEDRQQRLAIARERLKAAAAHYVVDNAADVEPVLDAIERRLAAGDRP